MHQRGRKLKVELIENGGAPQCAADVQAWDFGWGTQNEMCLAGLFVVPNP